MEKQTEESGEGEEREAVPQAETRPAEPKRDYFEQERHFEPPRLGPISLGLALGLTSAFFTFVLGMSATLFEWGLPAVMILSSPFIGYSPSFVGSISGAVWACVDGFVAGAMIAWLYNKFQRVRR